MGWFSDLFGPVEQKASVNVLDIPQRSTAEIQGDLEASLGMATATNVSAVVACARVISEGLALPPCAVVQKNASGGSSEALAHPLHNLISSDGRGPNARQTSFEFREQVGLHKALTGNAFVFINRSVRDGSILELIPFDPGAVNVVVDPRIGSPLYYRVGSQNFASEVIWHLKGPAWLDHKGVDAVAQARSAIGLACATETYGANLFKNGARPGGIIGIKGVVDADQLAKVREAWNAQYSGNGNSHKTALLPADIDYKPLSHSANDAQWIESRRFQIGEICRYFRVSPTKVFQSLGSQSYASVEQAHIAHDQDTDAPWHERFVQSANKALFTDAERKAGYRVTIDNRAALRGTAKERMEYYTKGVAAGIFTRNEAREMEGFDRSDDPSADELTPAVNLFGPDKGDGLDKTDKE